MSETQEKLNEQLFNVIADEKVSDEARLKKVKYLVRLGADVNARLYGRSVLSKAIEQNAGAQVVEFLREKGANEWVISKEEALELGRAFWDDKGDLKSLEEIKELLKKRADLDVKDKNGWTALMWAATWGKLDVVKCLVEHGSDLDVKDKYGNTELGNARMWRKADCVKFLEEAQKKVSAQKTKGDKTGASQILKKNEGR